MFSKRERAETKEEQAKLSSSVIGFGTGKRKFHGAIPVAFTGPDALRDYRAKVKDEHRYIGEGPMSVEGTSEANYLWRAAKYAPHPIPKNLKVSEIGWGVVLMQPWFESSSTGAQFTLGEFRQEQENKHTHRQQNPRCAVTGHKPIPKDPICRSTCPKFLRNFERTPKQYEGSEGSDLWIASHSISQTGLPQTNASQTDASQTDVSQTDASQTNVSQTDASQTNAS